MKKKEIGPKRWVKGYGTWGKGGIRKIALGNHYLDPNARW